jgi:nucleotide-binding universal stress UspA family protein
MRLLVAVDESDHAGRMMKYVGTVFSKSTNVHVTLFHVLGPMPRKYLEHGGSENPEREQQIEHELRTEQRAWLQRQREAECPYLIKARDALIQTGMSRDAIDLKFGNEEDVARNILEEAQAGGCETVVIGRGEPRGLKRMFGGGITEELLRSAKGLAVWIVD